MAIIKTVTDDYEFADWVKRSDNYKNNFSVQGAKALQEYLEQLSDDIGENIEFDPIAWCCEYSEFKDWVDAYANYGDGSITSPDEQREFIDERTQTYEFDGGIIVQDF